MKNLKYIIGVFLTFLMLFTSCQDDNVEFGDLIAPSNIQLTVDIVGADATNPNGDGSGTVNFTATADNVTTIHFVVQNITKLASGGSISHDFTQLGLVTYPVTVIAFGTGGVSSSKTFEVEVLSTYEPPADLLTMLTANSSRTWKVAGTLPQHFGLGPVGGSSFGEYYPGVSDQTNAKAGAGVYDDRYIFDVDGTFTHITNGTVFGREVLINELGGSGGTVNGADIENYVFGDYTAQWSLTAPGGVETLSLTGIGFIGYYVGGNHKYEIFSRSANEMVLRTTDGNGDFDWWFKLIPE
ncbi:glucan endo-1,3-beta-D-glucosidase [Mariniflexile sp.]|uniref:glucan endo-1,3-beta-D-glucosidase n=1 Tax=Mariniflexile sp. TaxID=1979402 RepID=UPI003567A9FA